MSALQTLGNRLRQWADRANLGLTPPQEHRVHLDAAMAWLKRAQDATPDAGVAQTWLIRYQKWAPSYPETTGYIIETLLEASRVLGRPELVERARRMIEWELSIQQPDGAFPGHFGEPGSRPVIFNTGQIMHGMIAGHLQLGRSDCLEAAVRAGHWLADQQDADGCFRRFEHHDTPHVYNTRATWPLLSTGLIAGEKRLVDAARKHMDWALTQQTPSGWFQANAFVPWRNPFTHTIAYAIRGLLEAGVLLGEDRWLAAALKAGRGMAAAQRADGWLAGTYRDGWVADASYSCLTGVAQMSLNWTRLAQATGDETLRTHARAGLQYVKRTQRLDHPDPAVRGGIAGSAPIWGDYSRFEYPNWAAKFFADALMMDLRDLSVPPVPAVARGVRRDG